MKCATRIEYARTAIQFAAARGDHQAAAEMSEYLAELERAQDARPEDFADDCCGDHTMTPVAGWLC